MLRALVVGLFLGNVMLYSAIAIQFLPAKAEPVRAVTTHQASKIAAWWI